MPAGTALAQLPGLKTSSFKTSYCRGSEVPESSGLEDGANHGRTENYPSLHLRRQCGIQRQWSQELKLQHSLVEYIASSMLIDILTHANLLGLDDSVTTSTPTIFDLS